MPQNPKDYFRKYRRELGFTNQNSAKAFLAAKDILAPIDYSYIESLLDRLQVIIERLNGVVHEQIRLSDLTAFCAQRVQEPVEQIQRAGILPRLNNQGRRPEEVLFSWLRGHAANTYFTPALARIFGLEESAVVPIGDDDLTNPDTFRRTPKADIQIAYRGKDLRIEVQSGFQGINDIKEHKVREARRVAAETGNPTLCVHYDVYNGQAAFVRIDQIEGDDVNWVTRQQMEGQSVFAIEQNYFDWRFIDAPPSAHDIEALEDL